MTCSPPLVAPFGLPPAVFRAATIAAWIPAFALLSAVTFAATYLLTAGRHFKSQVSALRSKISSLSPIFLALVCAGGATLLAALLEAMQLDLPNRSADWRDILNAALGALAGPLIPAP